MNKAELVSHLAAETPTTRAAAERMVEAVFAAITDALARDEPVAIAGFGKFALRSRAARQGRNPRTGSRSPSRRRRRRRSSPRKPFATRSTNSRMGQAATCSSSASATLPPHVCCSSLCSVGTSRYLTGLFRRRIAWDDGTIREGSGAGEVAFAKNRCC